VHKCGCGTSPGANQTAHLHLNYASPSLGCSITSVCESVCLLSRPCLWPRSTHFAFYVLLYIYTHLCVYPLWTHSFGEAQVFVFVNLGNACKRFLFGSAAVYLFKFNASTYPPLEAVFPLSFYLLFYYIPHKAFLFGFSMEKQIKSLDCAPKYAAVSQTI